MNDRDNTTSAVPMLFTEKKINTTLLGLAFAFSVAGGITLLVQAWQTDRYWPIALIGLGLMLWGLMIGNNLARRRKLSPVLRLEADRVRYIGGPAWNPQMIDLAYKDITQIEKVRGSGIVLRLRDERKARLLPVGLLSQKDRQCFIQSFQARCDAITSRHGRVSPDA